MPTRPQLPPPNLMIPELRSANPSDVFFRELVDRTETRWRNANPIKRGTLYSSLQGADPQVIEMYPLGLYFLSETVPIGSNTVAGMTQADFVIWNWMSEPAAESPTNAEISLLADSISNPVFARTYIVRREVYENDPYFTTGLPFTGLLGARVLRGGTSYTNGTCTLVGPGSDSGAIVTPVFADGVCTHCVVEDEGEDFDSTSTIQLIGDGVDGELQLILQPVAAVLTSQKKVELADDDPRQPTFVKVLRVYELLPGPWIPFTRYDDDLGPVQGRRRAVLNTGQLGGVIGPTYKTNYEGRDGSSVVSIEIQENWSDGTGIPGSDGTPNPLYPRIVWATYSDERGDVQHFSQVQRADPLQAPPDATLVRLLGKMVKTFYEPFPDNPYLLKKIIETWVEVSRNDQQLTHEFGGAIANSTERRAEPGVLSPERGLMVVSSETQTISPHEQRLLTVKSPLSEWPPLHGFHTDEETGIVINFVKQVVPEGTPYPGKSPAIYRGPFVEMQTYDFDKSIQIISAIDPTTLPGEESVPIKHAFTLPPTLLSVEAVWTDTKSKLAAALADSATATVHTGSGGDAIVRSSKGFRGQADGYRVRNYYPRFPTGLGEVPNLFKIIPTSGSIVFTATDSNTRYTNQDDGGQIFGDGFTIAVHAADIRDHLVGPSLQIIGGNHTSPPQSANAESGGGSIASVSAAGTPSKMTVSIPFSTPYPESIPSGTPILYDIDVYEWRKGLGVWIVDRIYIYIP